MEIKTKKLFKELVKKLTMELLDEESIEEITTTGDVAGYSTPFAFSSKEDEKKKKKRLTRSTGYSVVKEALNNEDLKKFLSIISIKQVESDVNIIQEGSIEDRLIFLFDGNCSVSMPLTLKSKL